MSRTLYTRTLRRGLVKPAGTYTLNSVPEPLYIAHRGGAYVFPEDTMEAFQGIRAAGSNLLEADCHLLSDGVTLGIMHDNTVDRTTTSTGNVADLDDTGWAALVLDAQNWFGGDVTVYTDLHAPTFEEMLEEFQYRAVVIPEAKNTGSGAAIVAALQAADMTEYAIVQSYTQSDLTAAINAGIPVMHLGDSLTPANEVAAGNTYIGVSTAVNESYIDSLTAVGLKVIVYTVSRRTRRDIFLGYGVSGFFSDDPIYLAENLSRRRTTDPFSSQTYYYGHIHGTLNAGAKPRGVFLSPNRWGFDADGGTNAFLLQGWGCPIAAAAATYSITLTVTYDAVPADTTRWASIMLCAPTDIDFSDGGASAGVNGYHILFRANGAIAAYKITDGVVASIGTLGTGDAISTGGTATFRVDVTPTTVTVTRLDGTPASGSFADSTYRGGYFHFGKNGVGLYASFSDVSIT